MDNEITDLESLTKYTASKIEVHFTEVVGVVYLSIGLIEGVEACGLDDYRSGWARIQCHRSE